MGSEMCIRDRGGDGRITTEADGGDVRDRLYATGWAKRGPVGLIGSTKSDALMIVTNISKTCRKPPRVDVSPPTATPNPSTVCLPNAVSSRSISPDGSGLTRSNGPKARKKAANIRRSSILSRCVSSLTPSDAAG